MTIIYVAQRPGEKDFFAVDADIEVVRAAIRKDAGAEVYEVKLPAAPEIPQSLYNTLPTLAELWQVGKHDLKQSPTAYQLPRYSIWRDPVCGGVAACWETLTVDE